MSRHSILGPIAAVFALACLAGAALPAAANDTVAVMGTGGLVLQRTDGIEMRAEDLYVSAAQIRVKYRFFNNTAQDISTVVAFPMPDVTGRPESDIGISTDDPTELTPFTTTVDGVQVHTQVEQKALLAGIDYTDELVANGVPLQPYLMSTTQVLGRLSPAVLARLTAQGLIEDRGYTGDDGAAHPDYAALWTVKTTHYWTQVFPANKEIDIDHRYTPAVGGTVETLIGKERDGDAAAQSYWNEQLADYGRRYCTDRGFIATARGKWQSGLTLSEAWVDYVLVTGANWSKPIGDFRLVVDKGEAGNLVSFCETGVKKIGPTTFEVRHTNFTPTHDLSVLILHGERLVP